MPNLAQPLLIHTSLAVAGGRYEGVAPYSREWQAEEMVPFRQREAIYGPPSLQPSTGIARTAARTLNPTPGRIQGWEIALREWPHIHRAIVWGSRTRVPLKTADTDTVGWQLARVPPHSRMVVGVSTPTVNQLGAFFGGVRNG